MNFRTALLTASAGLIVCTQPVAAHDPGDYPATRATDLVETKFGEEVADPYRWLENDVRVDPEVAAWVDKQSRFTAEYLATLPGRDAYAARIKQLYDYERFGLPTEKGGRYFYTRNDGLQNQSVLYVRDGIDGEGRVLIDPNAWAADGATALADWVPTKDGSKLLYGIQDGGSDWRTAKVLDVATGEILSDTVEWIKFSALEWDKDGEGFFYSRFPVTEDGETFQALNTDQKVYYHRLGTDQSADEVVFATPDRPELNNTAVVSDDGRYLITSSSSGTDDRYEVSLIDLTGADRTPRILVPGFESNFTYVGNEGDRFVFLTNEDAPLQKVVAIDITDPKLTRETIIAERDMKLDGVSMVGGRLVAEYLADAKSEIAVHALDGSLVRQVALPGIGSANGFDGDAEDGEVFYAFSSFNRPTTIYSYDLTSGESDVWAQPEIAFDPDDYVVQQQFYTSKDGTQVPMFLVRRADIAASGQAVPTLLYGYGGFNISVTPGFSPSRIAWMDAGGAYALANIRGGGEYGKAWHDGGRRANKQNVFDDFAAAGEYLKANGITTANGLAIEGRSNGGLLVGAVVNQRPDLVDAAHGAVGVMDMLRFDQFTAGRYWVDDYGYPDRPEDFALLRAYSPYHNIQSGTDYPAVLVTTADTDDRVVPGHSFKYAAALQAADVGDKPHLIRIETRAGHGSGKPTDKAIEE
ncbi:MAG: prolyl oligopeptidase family serine peptidase, partial [Pontixanthobacter sp.]